MFPTELLECIDKVVECISFEDRNDLTYHAVKPCLDRMKRIYALKKELQTAEKSP